MKKAPSVRKPENRQSLLTLRLRAADRTKLTRLGAEASAGPSTFARLIIEAYLDAHEDTTPTRKRSPTRVRAVKPRFSPKARSR